MQKNNNLSFQKIGDPVETRKRERDNIPGAFEGLLQSIHRVNKVLESFNASDEKFVHLDGAEMEKVSKAISERQQWVDRNMGAYTNTKLFQDVPVTASQIYSEKGTFEALVNPIINKPKPKPKVSFC